MSQAGDTPVTEESDFFISPHVQQQVAAAVFIVEEQLHANQDSDGAGMGVSLNQDERSQLITTFLRNGKLGPRDWDEVPGDTGKAYGRACFAILEAAKDHPLTALTDSNNLRGSHLVLASFFGVAKYAPMFKRRLGFYPASGGTTSPYGHHLFYICTAFAGDSGAALLLKDGELVGLHVEMANAARERLERMQTDLRGTWGEVEESLDAIVSGHFGQGAVAVLDNAFGA